MRTEPNRRVDLRSWCRNRDVVRLAAWCITVAFVAIFARAQDDPLNKVHVNPPASATPATGAPAGAQA
ncbi:MAG: hypothetical protein WCC26_21720, partial [Terracidiphilus sp.]